jgi:hypothetical protein
VLNGVGGRTIAEAQERMSLQEFSQWVAFRKKRGGLHPGRRIDRGFALLASMYANTHTKNGGFKTADFQPFEDDDKPISLVAAMENWD